MSALSSRANIIGAALLWSTGGAAIKWSTATAPQLAVGRAVVAAAVLLAFFPSSRRPPSRSVLITGFFYACTCALFVFANTLTTAANTIFIQNTAPIWVLLLSPWLLGEHPSAREKASVPISLVGCALFFLDDMSAGRMAGNLCAAAASVSYALLIMRYRKGPSDEGMAATVYGNLMVTAALLPFALDPAGLGIRELAVFAYLGAVQQALAAFLFVRGIRGVSAMEGALLILFEPLLSPVWALLLVGERVGPLAIAGALLVLGATLWRTLSAVRPS